MEINIQSMANLHFNYMGWTHKVTNFVHEWMSRKDEVWINMGYKMHPYSLAVLLTILREILTLIFNMQCIRWCSIKIYDRNYCVLFIVIKIQFLENQFWSYQFWISRSNYRYNLYLIKYGIRANLRKIDIYVAEFFQYLHPLAEKKILWHIY